MVSDFSQPERKQPVNQSTSSRHQHLALLAWVFAMIAGSIKLINILIILTLPNLDILTLNCDHLILSFVSLRPVLGSCLSTSFTTTNSTWTMSAAVTGDDLAKFSKEQTELIMKLREEDKKERASERAEDIVILSKMIGQTMDVKLETALKPVVERQDSLEKRTHAAISDMSAKITAFEAIVAATIPQPQQSYAAAAASAAGHAAAAVPAVGHTAAVHAASAMPRGGLVPPSSNTNTLPRPEVMVTLDTIISDAKLTLGFSPIEKCDLLKISRTQNISDEQEIMKHAIVEFLRLEMSIKTVGVTDIVKVFHQAGIPEQKCNRVYAQFRNQNIISTVYRHVSMLRTKEHRVQLYAPHTHQDQIRYLGDLANRYRNPADKNAEKVRTRIMFGLRDLYLQIKPLGSTYWTTVDTPDLPPIQPSSQANQGVSVTPPAGRQRDEPPNKRAASMSPECQSKPKDAKITIDSLQDTSTHDIPEDDSNTSNTEEAADNTDDSDKNPVVPDVGDNTDSDKNSVVPDVGDFVSNQVFSPKTGALTFNFQAASRRYSLHSLNL